jgi:hypothetical protein
MPSTRRALQRAAWVAHLPPLRHGGRLAYAEQLLELATMKAAHRVVLARTFPRTFPFHLSPFTFPFHAPFLSTPLSTPLSTGWCWPAPFLGAGRAHRSPITFVHLSPLFFHRSPFTFVHLSWAQAVLTSFS